MTSYTHTLSLSHTHTRRVKEFGPCVESYTLLSFLATCKHETFNAKAQKCNSSSVWNWINGKSSLVFNMILVQKYAVFSKTILSK